MTLFSLHKKLPEHAEVPLKWADFTWSLERLRHKAYSKKTSERDWFRINPLEMVLLGCQTLYTRTPSHRVHGTLVLVMECIEHHMRLRPRYWNRLLAVLIKTCQEDIPPLILQQCVSILVQFWKSFLNIPEYYPALYSWGIHEMEIVSFLKWLMRERKDLLGVQHMHEVTLVLVEIQETVTASEDAAKLLQSYRGESNNFIDRFLMPVFCNALPEYNLMEHISMSVELFLMQKCDHDRSMEVTLSRESLQQLVETLETVSKELPSALANLIHIIQLLSVRWMEFSEASSPGHESKGSEDHIHLPPNDLLASLTSALLAWESMLVASNSVQWQSSSSDIASNILSLAHVMLSSGSLDKMLPMTTDFFTNTISTLMIYSTEGYLTNSPNEFFLAVIEYVSSLVEQGVLPSTVIQTYLPNLFGPFFGTRNHAVSCKLLEYGYLAACSQHRKSLLSEGLTFLMEVFRLFPPIDKTRVEMAANMKRVETVEMVSTLLDDLVTSVLRLVSDKQTGGGRASEHGAAGIADDDTIEGEDDVGDQSGILCTISDAEREADNNSRMKILLHLLELACAMVRNGDNMSYLFANVLPKLFSKPTPTTLTAQFTCFMKDSATPSSDIPWQVDRKEFAIRLLRLATLSRENDMASPFQICAVVAPKLVKNLDTMTFSDKEKMALTIEIINITCECLESGYDINELISHGVDLLTILLPQSSTPEELKTFIGHMARQFVSSSHTSILFLLKQSCHFMIAHFTEERETIQELFKALILKAKRDEIRGIFRVCREELLSDKYTAVRRSLYSYGSGALSHRQLIALCDILLALMNVEKPREVARWADTMESDIRHEEKGKRSSETALVLGKLTEPCLQRFVTSLTCNKFNKQQWEEIREEISRIALFSTLFSDEFSSFTTLSATELLAVFQSKFPPDVLNDVSMMQLLALCGSRIEHMQVPRYQSLKSLLSRVLQYYLTLDVPSVSASDTPTIQTTMTVLECRESLLKDHLLHSFPRNDSDRKTLIECGYSSKLWEGRLSLVVETDGSHSLDENMRQTLLACYREFTDILKQMGITHVSVDGELVKSNELFSDELSLTELKGRRAIAVRAIDVKLGGMKEGYFQEKKISLLAKEDKVEQDFEEQAMAPVKPKKFTVALNTTFFDCARCCGAHIIGCYAPTGEHCERPLEIGIRCDSAIASIYDESGLEIENFEMLFTPEGAYMFKAYSNGHPYDTSQVWVGLLTALLAEPSSLVPAIIIPKSYPNQRTWDTIRRSTSTELTGGILTCQHDFSPEWRTYYDHRPEKVRNGMDIVLHPGFSLSMSHTDHSTPALRRQRSRIAKDLAGMMFDHVMQDLLQDEWWKQFRFLGKYISQYLSVCVENGELQAGIIEDGLNYERWRSNYLRLKNAPQMPQSICERKSINPGFLPTKQQLVSALVDSIDTSLKQWSAHTLADVTELCTSYHKQFLELKGLVERSKGSLVYLKQKLPNIRGCLKRCTFMVPLLSLPDALQEEVIHWVFRNEDRVWRYRGGRDGRETLQQFMSFLGRRDSQEREGDKPRNVFAGVVAFCVPNALESGGLENIRDSFQVVRMVGYAVGEVIRPSSDPSEEVSELEPTRWQPQHNTGSCYEVVTAWVHPSYRGLNLGVRLYLDIVEQVPTRLVMCDMLEGSVERIIRSNGLLRLLGRLHVLPLVLHCRQRSYAVVTQEATSEQYEQVVFSVWPIRAALTLHNLVCWIEGHSSAAIIALPPITALAFMVIRRWML